MAERWSSVFRRAFADSLGSVSLLHFGAFYWFWIEMRVMVPAFCNITEPCPVTLWQMCQQHSCYHLMSSRWLDLNPWGVPLCNETTLGPSRSRPMYLCIWKNVPGHHPRTVHWTCCRQQQLAVLEDWTLMASPHGRLAFNVSKIYTRLVSAHPDLTRCTLCIWLDVPCHLPTIRSTCRCWCRYPVHMSKCPGPFPHHPVQHVDVDGQIFRNFWNGNCVNPPVPLPFHSSKLYRN